MTTTDHLSDPLAQILGSLQEPGNPAGANMLLAADEQGRLPAAEHLLDRYGVGAELVPPGLGGRFASLPRLIRTLRVVFGRDAALGLASAGGALMAAANVWVAGDEAQQTAMARVLLGGGRVATGYHELAHGNDFARASLCAFPGRDGRLRLTGGKEVISNAARAEALVLFARTSPARGNRSHSLIFVERCALDPSCVIDLPRFTTAGLQGVPLQGFRFIDCPVPSGSIVGTPGTGIETGLRSFQVSRIGLPGMWAGSVETGLWLALRFVIRRRLYGRPVKDIPIVRRQLAECFADLLLCEAMVEVAARVLHLRPGQGLVVAALTKHFVSGCLLRAMSRLSKVLGAHFYLREGEYALFQKHLRDLAPIGFGHTARGACLATALPQLPRLAQGAWQEPVDGDVGVFDVAAPLPPLDFRALQAGGDGRDELGASLLFGVDADVPGLSTMMVDVRESAARLTIRDVGPDGGPRPARLTDAYSACLAGAAARGVTRHAHHNGADPFLREPFLRDALTVRALATVTQPPPALPESVTGHLFDELVARYEAGLSFELTPRLLHR
ncbi:acyl-CoA dehydrogenase [Actinoplanes sp. NPDC051475]|uniref:acyl-CoA dehydrogenase n=1 Tax=Actinoplanes sp. NPDC051475 TaxID=3157225 RepID=UPI00344FE429